MFSFFIENDLISQNLGLNQVTPALTSSYQSPMRSNLLMMGGRFSFVSLDISKAFDKLWHQGVILKLKQNDISKNLLKIIEDFLSNRSEGVVLNGQSSGWAAVNARVPQGSIHGPLLFLVYVNDLSTGLSSNPRFFADYTSLFSVAFDRNTSANELNNDLLKIRSWAYQWKMSFNPDTSKQSQEVIFSRKLESQTILNLQQHFPK